MTRSKHGVSGVLAMVLISLMIIIFLVSYAYVTEQSRRIQALVEERYRIVTESREIAKNVASYWRYNELTGILELEVTNGYKEPLTIMGVVIIDELGGYSISKLSFSMAPGENKTLMLALTRQPKAVYISVAGKGPVSATVSSQKVVEEEVTTIKTWNGGLLDKIYSGYIKTQYGNITIMDSISFIGTLLRGDVNGINITESDLQRMSKRDNVNATITIPISGRKVVNITLEGELDRTACLGDLEVFLDVSASASLTGGGQLFSFKLYLYNYTTGNFDLKVSSTHSIDYTEQIPIGNGSYKIRLSVEATQDVRVEIDVANIHAYCKSPIYSGYALLIGDSEVIDFYSVLNSSLGVRIYSVNLNMSGYSLGSNASFSLIDNKLFHAYIDGNDVVIRFIDLSNVTEGWTTLTRCLGFGLTNTLVLEPLGIAGRPYLLVAGTQKYCLVDASNATAPSVNVLPGIMIGTTDGFVSSASDYQKVYLTGINASNSKPSIFVFDGLSFDESIEIPVARPVGLTISNGTLWLIGDSGTLYVIDTYMKQVSIYEVIPGFLPREKGDKLEIINDKLVFIRGDSTSEYWILEVQ